MAEETPATAVRTLKVEISFQTLLASAAIVGGIWLLGKLAAIIVVLLAALMLAGALSPLVLWLQKRGIRRSWALALVFVLSVLVFALIAFVTLPALWAQVGQIITDLPALQERVAHVIEGRPGLGSLAGSVRRFQLAGVAASPGTLATLAEVSLGVLEVVGYGATAMVLSLYFLSDHERMRGALFALVPRRFHLRTARILRNLETIVGGYIRGQLLTSLAIAVFVFVLLTIFKVPNALALAAFAGLTDVVPFVGGFLATAPAVIASLHRGPTVAVTVLALLIGYQEFESRILVPRVYGSTLRLPSVAVVVALLIGGKLGGIVGALLSLPVAAALLMMIEELRLNLPGDDSDDPVTRQRDAKAEQAFAAQSAGASPEEAAKVAGNLADEILKEEQKVSDKPESLPVTDGKRT